MGDHKQSSRRRAIIDIHGADGRPLHPRPRTPSTSRILSILPFSACTMQASCRALPFTLRTKTIRCLSASLRLIVASCANSPRQLLSLFYLARLRRGPYSSHNHIIGHCRPHSIISSAIAAPAPSMLDIFFMIGLLPAVCFRRTLD
jgi:hypothetical protein